MRKQIRSFLLGVVLAAGAAAQEPELPAAHGYMFFAPGMGLGTGIGHFGVGGQGLVYRRLGVGAELGYLFLMQSLRAGGGVASVNGYYHFLDGQSPRYVDPFVTAGYSLGFRQGSMNLINFGAGATYWIGRRAGLRLEWRDHFSRHYGSTHFWGIRVGVAFR